MYFIIKYINIHKHKLTVHRSIFESLSADGTCHTNRHYLPVMCTIKRQTNSDWYTITTITQYFKNQTTQVFNQSAKYTWNFGIKFIRLESQTTVFESTDTAWKHTQNSCCCCYAIMIIIIIIMAIVSHTGSCWVSHRWPSFIIAATDMTYW